PSVLDRAELVMGAPPCEAVPLDVQIHAEERLEGYVRRTISFAVEPGDRVPAYLLIPNGARRAPAAVCLHQTTKMGKAEPVGLGLKNLAYAKELAERGFVALAPDYPNFGDYKVDVYARGWASATRKGIWNHMRAVDVLRAMPEVDPEKIAAIGHSLGGHNAIFLGAFDPRVKAVVSSCGFTAFPKYMRGNLAGWSHKGYMPRIAERYGKDPARMPFDFTDLVASLAPRAFFANAPTRDDNFEVSGVRDVFDAARPAYAGIEDRLVAEHPDAGHDFPPDVRERAYAFLKKALY
ncbi:MAG TPA: alpha/beta fold hydrolase, partial [Planctomycetota bacterium]